MREGTLANEKAQARLRARERHAEELRASDLRYVMGTAAGRRVIADFVYNRCRWGGMYASNDSGLHRHEGRRAVGVELIAELESICYDEYVLMVTERMADRQDEKAVRDAAQDIGESNG